MKGMGTDDNNRTDLRRGRGVRWIRRRTVVFFHSCLGVAWHPFGRFCLKHRGWNTSDTSAPGLRPGVPLASLWCRLVSAAFAWQAWGNVHCQGVGCTPWRPSGVPWSPPLLRGRRGTMSIAKGSDVRPGVPLASLWCPLVSAAFAWQAWGNVHCQGVGCTPWRPSGVPLVSHWCPLVSAAFAWQAWDNVHC